MYHQPLPARPSLAQLKRRANELHSAFVHGKQAAAARVVTHHPRFKGKQAASVLGQEFVLADAQLVIAREHGVASWAALKPFVETKNRVARFTPHPRFGEAVAALVAGDVSRLGRL